MSPSIPRRRLVAFALLALLLVLVGVALRLWFLPHRDVAAAPPDAALSVAQLVADYARDSAAANQRYLATDGDSAVLALTGTIHSVRVNQSDATVVLLREPGATVGAACTFAPGRAPDPSLLAPGRLLIVKGVIRAGPRPGPLPGLMLDAVLDDCIALDPGRTP